MPWPGCVCPAPPRRWRDGHRAQNSFQATKLVEILVGAAIFIAAATFIAAGSGVIAWALTTHGGLLLFCAGAVLPLLSNNRA